ncbi:hypothetical protein AB0F07_29495 [Streptomyces fructofermentans]|uniref:hypothetical protein n=2 Tax=Streptomycetaceae TaxID=2062 RepID=UPI0033E48701
MNMGISGFEPSFLIGVDAIRQAHGSRLAALAGRRLTGFALVRFAEDGDWFADCPVVLDFDGIQVECCHWKFDELSIGWDTYRHHGNHHRVGVVRVHAPVVSQRRTPRTVRRPRTE